MALRSPLHRLAAVLALGLLLAGGAQAVQPGTQVHGPEWSQLTAEQQRILAPLADDWRNIEPKRRDKWVEIAKRYPKMSAQQQERLQSQMKQWASLNPEQRAEVRARYKKLKEMPPQKREEIHRKWREYEELTEEQKHALRKAHPGRPPRSVSVQDFD